MRKIPAKIGVTALSAFALFAISVPDLHAAVANCNSPNQSLQGALDDAVDGDIIKVIGTCNELITINVDNITLDGGGTAVIDGTGIGGTSDLLRVLASNVTIRDITVQNSPDIGITIDRSGSAVIRGATVQGNARHGISVARSSAAVIGAGSSNHDNPPTAGSEGNIISGNGGHGVIVRHSSGVNIFHNNILNNVKSGIFLAEGSSADIDGNSITGNTQRGIELHTNASVKLSDQAQHGEMNLIEENTKGVLCQEGGALRGNPQDFGTGNPGSGDHTDDTDIDVSCPVAGSLAFP